MIKTTIILIIMAAALFSSCATTVEFPVSDITPAAEITAEIKEQGKPNHLVTITANNLASPDRIQPPKELYVIWVVSESGVTRNVGHFYQVNAEKATYKASFPYKPVEIFITAEDKEGLCEPEGTVITRVKL